MLQVFLEYDIIYIPHKKLNFAWKINFLIIPVIFHIPKISIFPLLKVFFGIFLEYSIFQIFQYFLVEGLFWNIPFLRFSYSMEYSMEYSTFKNELVLHFWKEKENQQNGIFQKNVNKYKNDIFGIWNIAGILRFSIVNRVFRQEYSYSKKHCNKINSEIFGIWNIPGIFQKNRKTS